MGVGLRVMVKVELIGLPMMAERKKVERTLLQTVSHRVPVALALRMEHVAQIRTPTVLLMVIPLRPAV